MQMRVKVRHCFLEQEPGKILLLADHPLYYLEVDFPQGTFLCLDLWDEWNDIGKAERLLCGQYQENSQVYLYSDIPKNLSRVDVATILTAATEKDYYLTEDDMRYKLER